MKINDYLLLAGTLCYSYLFYEQHAGLNFPAFNLVVVGLLMFKNRTLLYNKKWWLAVACCLASAVAAALHNSVLSIFANVCSLLVLSGYALNSSNSVVLAAFFSLFSVIGSWLHALIDAIRRNEKKTQVSQVKRGYRWLTFLSVTVLALLFFFLYRGSNPLFAENTKWINLDFISWSWLIFTTGGFFVVYGLFYHKTIPSLERWENEKTLVLNAPALQNKPRFEAERVAGVWLFVLLNLMLLVLNTGDLQTIWFHGKLPGGVSHSDFVHHGVGLVILSVIIATALIIYLFRSDFTGEKLTKPLTWLVYAWVFQNLIMLFSTAMRNGFYIHAYQLTYKRIGVYVWLFMAAIGLLILFTQVLTRRSAWYLVKTNLAIGHVVLAMSPLINWDLVITRYNLKVKALADVDLVYLLQLSDSNIPELIDVGRRAKPAELKNGGRLAYRMYYSGKYEQDFREALTEKVRQWALHRNHHWQSWNARDSRIEAYLLTHNSRK